MWEMESITSISTSLSARSLTVHFDLPSGGSERQEELIVPQSCHLSWEELHYGPFHAAQNPNHPRNISFLFDLRSTCSPLMLLQSFHHRTRHLLRKYPGPSQASCRRLAFAKIFFQIVSFLFFQADNVQFLPSHDIYLSKPKI